MRDFISKENRVEGKQIKFELYKNKGVVCGLE